MALPKGFGSGGGAGGGAGSADVDKMIGKRVENMLGLYTLGFIAAWLATFAGTAVGYFFYPWAYPAPSGHYALIVLTIIEATGYLFCVKVGLEGATNRKKGTENAVLAATIGAVAVATIFIASFVHG